MGRILALDYGAKRTGVAVTDPDKIIASALDTVQTPTLISFLKDYLLKETVDTIVLGYPTRLDSTATHNTVGVEKLELELKKQFPSLNIERVDERFTSKMAVEAMVQGGMKKKNRRKKENVDKISAVIILQDYMKENGLW